MERLLTEFKAFATEAGLPAPAATRMQIVLDEMISNIVNHGEFPTESGKGDINIMVESSEQDITVIIMDGAGAFDPFSTPAPDINATVAEREIGGLGVHIVKNIMDSYEYQRVDQQNVTTLKYKLPQSHPQVS